MSTFFSRESILQAEEPFFTLTIALLMRSTIIASSHVSTVREIINVGVPYKSEKADPLAVPMSGSCHVNLLPYVSKIDHLQATQYSRIADDPDWHGRCTRYIHLCYILIRRAWAWVYKKKLMTN
jgi:hypothetical protein